MTMVKNRHTHHNNYDLYKDVEKIKDALFETTNDAKDKAGEFLSESMENIKDQSTKLKDNVATYTSEKPLKSLGITLLAGIAIGYFLHK